MARVTISRYCDGGGKTVGKMIAEKLDYSFADNEIIQRVAQEANVSADWVSAFEKEAGTWVNKIVSGMVSQRLLNRVLKDERGYLDEKIYLDYLVLIIAQMADEGDVVILGRGSQYILDDHPDATHVLLVNDFDHRVQFIQEHYDVTEKKARQWVSSEDQRRINLYKRLSKADYDDPSHYHMVLNMARVGMDEACKIVCDYVQA